MLHEFCMSSDVPLHLCEVSCKYLIWYQSYGADTMSKVLMDRWMADRWPDGRTLKISEGIT